MHPSQQYVKGLITVSAPFGGTTDQAITVRMGAVEWNINEWVKNPLSKVAKDLASHAQVRRYLHKNGPYSKDPLAQQRCLACCQCVGAA
jgi:hypothetical protein